MQSNSVRHGPGLWHAIHMLTFAARSYTDRLRVMYQIPVLISGIDCGYCWQHAEENLRQLPPNLDQYWTDELGLFWWSVDFHNVVNRMLGKPEFSREEAYAKYERLYRRQEDPATCGDCHPFQ